MAHALDQIMRPVLTPILRMTNPCFHLEARLKLKDDRTLEPMSPTPPVCTFPPPKKRSLIELAKGRKYVLCSSIMCQRHRQPISTTATSALPFKANVPLLIRSQLLHLFFLGFFSQSLGALRHLTTNSEGNAVRSWSK